MIAVRNSALRFKPLPELDAEGQPVIEKPPPPLPPNQRRVYLVNGGPQGKELYAEKNQIGPRPSSSIWAVIGWDGRHPDRRGRA